MGLSPKIRSVAIRVDSSQRIGSGHVMRCVTLASALVATGVEVSFICRDLPGHYADWLHTQGFAVTLLPASKSVPKVSDNVYSSWLGENMAIEIAQCQAALVKEDIDWIIVDHYALDATWERAVCPPDARILVIDDLADRLHDCNLLLDQNYHKDGAARYQRIAPKAELLLGPMYALLRPDFITCRQELRSRLGKVNKLLISFGGSDNNNVTYTVLRALARINRSDLKIDVIAGQANPHFEELRRHCNLIGAYLYRHVDNMAVRIAGADLGIGATGVSTWERAFLGLPTLAVSVADNQREIARQVDSLGLLRWLGDSNFVSENDWRDALDWACSNADALIAQSRAGMEIVDGMGAYRIIEKMHAN